MYMYIYNIDELYFNFNSKYILKTIIKINHDYSTALAGGTGGEPGIVLTSGTVSSCFERNAKRRGTTGWMLGLPIC